MKFESTAHINSVPSIWVAVIGGLQGWHVCTTTGLDAESLTGERIKEDGDMPEEQSELIE